LGRNLPELFGVWATPSTIRNLPTRRNKMKYKKFAEDWLDNAPRAYVHIGRFMLKYRYEYDRDWGMGWLCQNDLDWEDTPESNYYNEICHALDASCHNTCFIDDVLEAMKNKPFNQGE
jgi:hypothetical protein